ncbi:MAG: NAD(P)/FAD-dependent oxidoreductase [Hyphomicrobiales bacterium]|nr:NAD(P)/FAD-dependent oxidoreductase [Hyphomicrobiales bacterium]
MGTGVVGAAVARAVTLAGASVIVLEKATDILDGASKGNSAILHTGFDAPDLSLEQRFVRRGQQLYLDLRNSLNLPLLETGALVAAWTEPEEARLEAVLELAEKNGVRAELVASGEVQAREPNISSGVRAAVLIPGEHIIDPWSPPLAYLTQAQANGATVLFDAEVLAGKFDGKAWTLKLPGGAVSARATVNCAGLYGDTVDQRLAGKTAFQIRPRKGQFVVFDKAASKLFTTTILPVPKHRTKGIVVCRTIFGNVLVGPTAEEQEQRSYATVDRETLARLVQEAVRIMPALAGMPVTATYAGLRPATQESDYQLKKHAGLNLLTLGGIRSTGLSAALGLGEYAAQIVCEILDGLTEISAPAITPVPNIAEHRKRNWDDPGSGEIVCHCELVTRGEIESALASALPSRNLGGLKRRTRACMGQCQGFHCTARIAEITGPHFGQKLASGVAHE